MSKIMLFVSITVFAAMINFGVSTKAKVDELKIENFKLQASNSDMDQKIKNKAALLKQDPVPISTEYGLVLNQIRLMESYGGVNMDVQLEGAIDSQDISSHYEVTLYKGVRGLKIQIVMDKLSKETDMGDAIDDIHLLEQNTDFMVSQISKDNNRLIAKGEIYGI